AARSPEHSLEESEEEKGSAPGVQRCLRPFHRGLRDDGAQGRKIAPTRPALRLDIPYFLLCFFLMLGDPGSLTAMPAGCPCGLPPETAAPPVGQGHVF